MALIGAPFMIVLPSLSQLVSEVPLYSKNSSDNNYVTVPRSAALGREPTQKTAMQQCSMLMDGSCSKLESFQCIPSIYNGNSYLPMS